MSRAVMATGAALLAAWATSATAAPNVNHLTQDINVVRLAYPAAKPKVIGGLNALQLADIRYAGVQWSTVNFLFDRTNHLQSMTLRTTDASYDDVLKLASQNPGIGEPSMRFAAGEAPRNDDMQIRVCEEADGAVTLAYEPAASKT